MADFGDATAVNTEQDITLYDAIQNTKQIIINYWYEKAVGESDMHRVQNRPDFLTKATGKCGYSIAKMIDDKLAELFAAFSQSVGSDGAALTDDVILQAKEYLDLADAPFEGRCLIVDPESMTDLLKIDKYVRMDYVAGGVVPKGMIGRIYGCDVYMTNNLYALNTNYHNAAMMQREAIALIVQSQPSVKKFRWEQRASDAVVVRALWGALAMRDTFGVLIKTRS